MAKQDTMPQLLSVEEAASFLRVSTPTIYRWAREGFIPSIKVGGYRRFYREALARWLDAKTQEHRDAS